jgi:hypothetical protein
MQRKHSVTAAKTQSKTTLNKGGLPHNFKSVARRLGCDESEAAFDKALGKIGEAKVQSNACRKPKRRKSTART